VISVFVVPQDEDVAMAREGIEDLAFDATTGLAQMANIEIASDEWQELYHEILADYRIASKFLLYYLHLGLTTVKMQLESGLLRLMVPSDDGQPTPMDIARAVIDAAKPVAACLLHVGSVGDKLLIPDDEIAELEGGNINLGVGITVSHFKKVTNEEETQ
jgi:hypothetical protein